MNESSARSLGSCICRPLPPPRPRCTHAAHADSLPTPAPPSSLQQARRAGKALTKMLPQDAVEEEGDRPSAMRQLAKWVRGPLHPGVQVEVCHMLAGSVWAW